jgi:hypothetical protein
MVVTAVTVVLIIAAVVTVIMSSGPAQPTALERFNQAAAAYEQATVEPRRQLDRLESRSNTSPQVYVEAAHAFRLAGDAYAKALKTIKFPPAAVKHVTQIENVLKAYGMIMVNITASFTVDAMADIYRIRRNADVETMLRNSENAIRDLLK